MFYWYVSKITCQQNLQKMLDTIILLYQQITWSNSIPLRDQNLSNYVRLIHTVLQIITFLYINIFIYKQLLIIDPNHYALSEQNFTKKRVCIFVLFSFFHLGRFTVEIRISSSFRVSISSSQANQSLTMQAITQDNDSVFPTIYNRIYVTC